MDPKPGLGLAIAGSGYDAGIDNVSIVSSDPGIDITLDPQPPNNQYVIDATPSMPNIRAKARVINVAPDPTPTTTFTWAAQLRINKGNTTCIGPEVSYDADISQNTTTVGEALYNVTFTDPSAFRGGNLQLTATATMNDKRLTGKTPSDLRIEGTNPQRMDIQSQVDAVVPLTGFFGLQPQDIQDVLKRISCQESGQRQFRASANGGIGPPLSQPTQPHTTRATLTPWLFFLVEKLSTC